MTVFSLCNVVIYFGDTAKVLKFILPTIQGELTKPTADRLEKYIGGDAEIVKIDVLYCITFNQLLQLENATDDELKRAVRRFGEMYFITA